MAGEAGTNSRGRAVRKEAQGLLVLLMFLCLLVVSLYLSIVKINQIKPKSLYIWEPVFTIQCKRLLVGPTFLRGTPVPHRPPNALSAALYFTKLPSITFRSTYLHRNFSFLKSVGPTCLQVFTAPYLHSYRLQNLGFHVMCFYCSECGCLSIAVAFSL